MTWAVLLPMILLGVFKIVVSSLPNSTVGWFIGWFEIHSKLSDANASVTIDGKRLESEDKTQVIHYFNEATFVERYPVFPGYEQSYLHPENKGISVIIDTKKGKKDVRLFGYIYNDRVNVVKQHKKKIVAYRLLSESLQKMFYDSDENIS